MALKIIYKLSTIFVLLILLCTTSYANFDDVKVKIKNDSDQAVLYLIDNFRYLDFSRNLKVLLSNTSVLEDIRYTSKWGYLELRIQDSRNRLIYSYTPTGDNPEVTIFIENTDKPNELKVIRKRGLRD